MKQFGHVYPSENTGTGCTVTSKYGRTPSNKHGGVGLQQPCFVCRDNAYAHRERERDGLREREID